jgi:hypothetical protein
MKRAIILMAMIIVLTIGIVNALPTCDFDQTQTTAGTRSGYISGAAQNLSVTIAGGTGSGQNVTYCSIAVSSGTITGALVFNETTLGSNISYCNTTVNTMALVDTTTYTFTMTMKNETMESLGTCTETYIPDNTQPVCAHAQSSRTTYSPKQTWTITGTNALSATLQFGSNSPYTMTEASDVFTYTTQEGVLPEGTYTVTGTTSDGLNATTCLLDYIRIDSEAKLVQMAAIASQGQKGAEATTTVPPKSKNRLVILLILGAAAYFVINNKK